MKQSPILPASCSPFHFSYSVNESCVSNFTTVLRYNNDCNPEQYKSARKKKLVQYSQWKLKLLPLLPPTANLPLLTRRQIHMPRLLQDSTLLLVQPRFKLLFWWWTLLHLFTLVDTLLTWPAPTVTLRSRPLWNMKRGWWLGLCVSFCCSFYPSAVLFRFWWTVPRPLFILVRLASHSSVVRIHVNCYCYSWTRYLITLRIIIWSQRNSF